VQTVETLDSNEARRCRRAQYSGLPTALNLSGSAVLGLVRSVKEDRSGSAPRWIVTIIQKEEARSRSSAI
jgi:hypothetical protein